MGRYDTAVYADLTSLRAPSRFRLRRRHVAGPLRAVSARRSRGDFGVICMVAIAAAVAGGLFVVPYALREQPVAQKPVTANLVTVRPSEPAAIVKRIGMAPAQPVQIQPAAARTVTPAPVASREAASAPRDTSMFRVDQLPVLEDDGAAYDIEQIGASGTALPARSGRPVRRTSLSE